MRPARGGFALGLLVGLLIGLALALAVALYVSKVPVPFVNKVPQRTAEQDAAEAERNKGWDPNAGLQPGRAASAQRPAAPGSAPAAAPSPAAQARATGAGAAAPLSSGGGAETLTYFVQAGAYTRAEEAEAQRAKLALQGLDTRVTEREQSGRTVYRVRSGPYEGRGEAETVIEKLKAEGIEAALVRVQKQ
jgi:cell division protein FtsN